MHEPATAASCRRHALKHGRTSREYAAAMWAACRLMAMHDAPRSHWLEEQARAWAFYVISKEDAPGYRRF